MNDNDLAELKQIILDYEIVDPVSGTKNWTDVRQFNLMFSTEMGSVADGSNKVYLRPETAQGIFVNYLNVQKTGRMKIPFGIAQIGKAFRNEIVARQFIFRMREIEQTIAAAGVRVRMLRPGVTPSETQKDVQKMTNVKVHIKLEPVLLPDGMRGLLQATENNIQVLNKDPFNH